MISLRYGAIVSILLIVALVPTIIHTYTAARVEDGLLTTNISMELTGFTSKPTNRKAAWVKETFDSTNWIERRYEGAAGENVLLFVTRSYDMKRLYHHPEIGILRGIDLRSVGRDHLPGMPSVWVNVLRGRTERGLAAYLLIHDGQFIENPIRWQVATSVNLMFSPKKEMTLFFAYDDQAEEATTLQNSPAGAILLEAVNSFLSQTHISMPQKPF